MAGRVLCRAGDSRLGKGWGGTTENGDEVRCAFLWGGDRGPTTSLLCCSRNNLPAAPHSVLAGAGPKPKALSPSRPGILCRAPRLPLLLGAQGEGQGAPSAPGETFHQGRSVSVTSNEEKTKGLNRLRENQKDRRFACLGGTIWEGEGRRLCLSGSPQSKPKVAGAPQAVSHQHGDEPGIEERLAARSEKGPCRVWAPETRTWAGAARGSDFSGKLPSTGEEGTGSNTPGTTWSKACFSPSSSKHLLPLAISFQIRSQKVLPLPVFKKQEGAVSLPQVEMYHVLCLAGESFST